MGVLRLANIRNGLAYPHDDVCCFQSCHAHHKAGGYFRIDAMPYGAVIRLLQGGTICIIDATQHDKELSDALKFGVPTWCRVFNRAVGGKFNEYPVCKWETRDMRQAANMACQRPLVQTYCKLVQLYGAERPCIIGENVTLECHRKINFDDKPDVLLNLLRGSC